MTHDNLEKVMEVLRSYNITVLEYHHERFYIESNGFGFGIKLIDDMVKTSLYVNDEFVMYLPNATILETGISETIWLTWKLGTFELYKLNFGYIKENK
jgi:hypothetical protein